MRLARLIIKSLGSEPELPVEAVPAGKAKLINTDSDFLQEFEKHITSSNQQCCIVEPAHFHDMIETMKGLIVVVAELKQEHSQLESAKKEDEQMKIRVANHTSIIAGLEQMYEGRLMELREESNERIKGIEGAYERERKLILALKQECQEKNETINELNREIAQLNDSVRSLENQNEYLLNQLEKAQQDLVSFELIIKKNSFFLTTQLDTAKQKFQILFQSAVSRDILQYLDVGQLLNMRLISRRANYILRHDDRLVQLVASTTLSKVNKLKAQATTDIRQYDGLLEAFTEENVKQWALKYLYLRVRPGEYIGEVLADVTISEQSKKQSAASTAPQRKRSAISNFLFGEEKKDDKKLNIHDFQDEASAQKITARIAEFFQGTIQFNKRSSLEQFRTRMTQQLKQLKQATAQGNKISALVVYSKFLYLEAQDLAHLSQTLFAMLLKETRKANILQSECQDLREGNESTRQILFQLSEEKRRMEENNWKMEIEAVKHCSENTRLSECLNTAESSTRRLEEENKQLHSNLQKIDRRLEDATKRLKFFEGQFEGIHSLLAQSQQLQEDHQHRQRSATNSSAS